MRIECALALNAHSVWTLECASNRIRCSFSADSVDKCGQAFSARKRLSSIVYWHTIMTDMLQHNGHIL